ncbi:MAG: protein kinase [Verrucomicrobiota bacterium]|nr:protein kinase [Verrucomicrobiota bacterium]
MNSKKYTFTTNFPESIGPYKIIASLGRGGMGEVFLAEDPALGRKVALKRIRPELQDNPTIRSRFLREAKVASSLTHPSIIPILSIQAESTEIYYTMPYVEGETLRQILRATREQEKKGETLHPIGRSIPALSRIFLQVCEAIAYTHSKGVLHRDLKPENIIVGKYGEVMILDWGIADFIDSLESDESLPETRPKEEDLTRPGKITGTLAYMAPERLKGQSSSVQTDLYALGVILYQLLTLQLPFQRKTISAFRKQVDSEQIADPTELAPYRDIPHPLAAICLKCLSKNPADRFQSVEEIITELTKSIEGRPDWVFAAELSLDRKEDWIFQENVLLAKNLAITQNFDVTQWAALSISKASFAANVQITAEIQVAQKGEGLGFLLSASAPDQRVSLEEGYLLWIGSESHPRCQFFRNNVHVLELPKLFISPKVWHQIRFEKIDDNVKFYLDGELKFSFASHLPLPGEHVGLLAKDERFEIKNFRVYDGSHNAMVGCLAVPNAFLSRKLYDVALQEYRRIGHCFPGRFEGREALFRAGLTLLEKAKTETIKSVQEKLFHLALKEFEQLYRTPGAPLEYLGKSLVYQAMGDAEEEAKCLELALRKFPRHPLLPILKEHIVYRMHESSLDNREAAYRIILLAIRHIPDLLDNPDTRDLIESLREHWEPLPFIDPTSEPSLEEISIQLAFWLAKVPILCEIARGLAAEPTIRQVPLCNALHSLLELEAAPEVEAILKTIPSNALSPERFRSLEVALLAAGGHFQKAATKAPHSEARALYYLLRQALKKASPTFTQTALQHLRRENFSIPEKAHLDALELWSLLLDKKWDAAKTLIAKFSPDALTQENSPLHFPYGCWLYAVQGPTPALAHFGGVLDTPYPSTTALPSYFLTGRIDDKKGWIERAFWWEKKELYRQIDLFYKIIGKHGKTNPLNQ